jgi:hypothetical protein
MGERGFDTKIRFQRLTPKQRDLLEQYMSEVEAVIREEVRAFLPGEDTGDSGLRDDPTKDKLLETTRRKPAARRGTPLRSSLLRANGFRQCTPDSAGKAAAYQRVLEDWPRICQRPQTEWRRLVVASAKHGVADARRDRTSKGWHTERVTGENALAFLMKRYGDVVRIKTDTGTQRGTITDFSQDAAEEIDGVKVMTAFGPVTVALADIRQLSWPDAQALCSVSLACETAAAEETWEGASAYAELCYGDLGRAGG